MKLQKQIQEFVDARDWQQYHQPKDLLLGMIEEIGEFRNIIKWVQKDEEIKEKIENNPQEVDDFFGDILFELGSLANFCGVDMEKSLERDLKNHEERIPIKKYKGKTNNQN